VAFSLAFVVTNEVSARARRFCTARDVGGARIGGGDFNIGLELYR
jgi:hypothetical protein